MSGLRIIAGRWRGRLLSAPPGRNTRPTSIRARQAAFDILLHAPWAGASFLHGARVLDAFAGSGAYGLEALSRGAAAATFIEQDAAALACLRGNVAACKAEGTSILAVDCLRPPAGTPHDLTFLDPPYGDNLLPRALAALAGAGYFSAKTIFVAELGPGDDFTPMNPLAERRHGKARLLFWSG